MKKFSRLFACLLFLIIFLNIKVYAVNNFTIDTDQKNEGIIEVKINELQDNTKLMVEKENTKYYYNMDNKLERIPLQLGNGKYTISLLENISKNKFKVVDKRDFDINLEETTMVYLQSMKIVNWKNTNASKLALKLTERSTSDEEKVKEIYSYIVNNITYDLDKPNNITNNYVPDLDEVMEASKGICYDYAALFGGMMRSIGIPTKLVMGYKDDIKGYHAWNEVYINGNWTTIDTTYDSCYRNNGMEFNMIKDKKNYTKDKEY